MSRSRDLMRLAAQAATCSPRERRYPEDGMHFTLSRKIGIRCGSAAGVTAILFTSVGVAQNSAPPTQTRDARAAESSIRTTSQYTAQAAEQRLYDDTIVHDIAITFEVDDWLDALGCRRQMTPPGQGGPQPLEPTKPVDHPARIVVDGEVLERVGLRCKGNSSLSISGPKKPLNLTTDAFVEGQRLWGFDVVNFNNNWGDPSQMRDALALRLIGEVAPAPRFGFARVTIQGEYVGLYTLVEQVERTFSKDIFAGDAGLIIKGDSPIRIAFDSSPLTWLGEDLAPYRRNYEVKGAAADGDGGYVALRELTRALDAPQSAGGLSSDEFGTRIHDLLDVDLALWYLAANNVITNFDSYYVGKNFFLHRGQRDPRFHMVSWDVGLSFGLFGLPGGGGLPGVGPGAGAQSTVLADPFAQSEQSNRPLIRRLLAVPSFRADYAAHVRTLRDTLFTEAWIEPTAQRYRELVRAAAHDEAAAQGSIGGTYTIAHFEANLQEEVRVGGGGAGGGAGGGRIGRGAPGILPLVVERHRFLTEHPALQSPRVDLAVHDFVPVKPTAADDVLIRARFDGADKPRQVELRYKIDAGLEVRVPMAKGEGDTWTAMVPQQRHRATVTYAFRLGHDDGRAAFFPGTNWATPFYYKVGAAQLPEVNAGDLVLNEFLADNVKGLVDEFGENDDWVELYNRGDTAVSLDGYFLSDDPRDPFAFALTGTLEAGAHLLIWVDGDPEQGPLHAPFRLNKDGESLILATAEAIVDRMDFGEQWTDVSMGRVTDGAVMWDRCAQPSPLAPNECHGATPPVEPTPVPVEPTAASTAPATPTVTVEPPPTAVTTLHLPLLQR